MVAMPFFSRLPGRTQVRRPACAPDGTVVYCLPQHIGALIPAWLQLSSGLENAQHVDSRHDFAVSATVGHVSISPDKAAARRRAKARQTSHPFNYRFEPGHDEDEVSKMKNFDAKSARESKLTKRFGR